MCREYLKFTLVRDLNECGRDACPFRPAVTSVAPAQMSTRYKAVFDSETWSSFTPMWLVPGSHLFSIRRLGVSMYKPVYSHLFHSVLQIESLLMSFFSQDLDQEYTSRYHHGHRTPRHTEKEVSSHFYFNPNQERHHWTVDEPPALHHISCNKTGQLDPAGVVAVVLWRPWVRIGSTCFWKWEW